MHMMFLYALMMLMMMWLIMFKFFRVVTAITTASQVGEEGKKAIFSHSDARVDSSGFASPGRRPSVLLPLKHQQANQTTTDTRQNQLDSPRSIARSPPNKDDVRLYNIYIFHVRPSTIICCPDVYASTLFQNIYKYVQYYITRLN